MGLDAIPHDHPAFRGMVGAYGNRYSNLAVANADFLLIVGTRLDTRITGTRPDSFARGARIVHVDVDPNELGQKIRTARCVRADAKAFLSALADALPDPAKERGAWKTRIERWRMKYPTTPPSPVAGSLDPNRFVRILSEGASDDAIVAVDVGQHQMWVAQSFSLKGTQRALISGGMGSMGFALPAAIGACSGLRRSGIDRGRGGRGLPDEHPGTADGRPPRAPPQDGGDEQPVPRDGSTVPGDVFRWAAPVHRDRVQRSRLRPDREGVRDPRGDRSTGRGTRAAVRRMFEAKGPFLLEVELGQQTQVNPKLLVNRPIEDMFPFLSVRNCGRR